MTSPLTYVYCLVRSAKPPVRRSVASPMPGSASLRALKAADRLWLVVSSVPASDYGEDAVTRGLQSLDWVAARAVAHESVVERFLWAEALLPMQLFTLFTSDARAVEHVVDDGRRIARILARIEHQLEFGLRVTWSEDARRALAGGRLRSGAADSGVTYLERKRELLDVNRARLREARTDANRLYKAVAQDATEARRRTSLERAAPGSRLLLDAAFLVPTRRVKSFRAAVRRKARGLNKTAAVVSLTGPWPPYNFAGPASRADTGAALSRPPRRGRR